MRLLADECCDFAAVRALRAAGHDVLTVAHETPRADDEDVLRLAVGSNRIFLTEDKDFGRLVYAEGRAAVGVIFLRYPASVRGALGTDVTALVAKHGADLAGAFTVLEPGRVRIRRPPRA